MQVFLYLCVYAATRASDMNRVLFMAMHVLCLGLSCNPLIVCLSAYIGLGLPEIITTIRTLA